MWPDRALDFAVDDYFIKYAVGRVYLSNDTSRSATQNWRINVDEKIIENVYEKQAFNTLYLDTRGIDHVVVCPANNDPSQRWIIGESIFY